MSGWLFGRGAGGGGTGASIPRPQQAPSTFSTPSASPGGSGAASALQLVRVNPETGKFELGAEALSVLRSVRGPVAVAAVAGRARQGKSTLLNGLLRTAASAAASGRGFEVGPTTRPTTKGLWLWGAPIQVVDGRSGRRHSLLLIDCEGIDATDQTASYSAQIFSLALLLSSLLVLNQIGPIDEAALDRLSLVAALTRRIRVRADEGGRGGSKNAPSSSSDDSELSEFTPAFLWLLRDFYLQLRDERGAEMTADDYLEQCLAPTPVPSSHSSSSSTSAEAVASKNEVRSAIKRLFPRRGAAALVRPVADERDLQRLDSLPSSALRPEFLRGMEELHGRVLSLALPKKLGASLVTGPALAALAESYVSAINGGAVPSIASAWEGVAEAECRAAADAAEASYRSTFEAEVTKFKQQGRNRPSSSNVPPLPLSVIDAAHAAALLSGERSYDERALGSFDDDGGRSGGGARAAGDRRWRERAEALRSDYRARAEAEASAAAATAAAAAGAEVASFVARPESTLDGLAGAVARAEEAFASALGGREACAASATAALAWAGFLSGPAASAAKALAAREAAAAAATATRAAEAASASVVAEASALRERARLTDEQLQTAKSESSRAMAEVARLRDEVSAARAQAASAAAAAASSAGGAQAQLEQARAVASAAEAKAAVAEREVSALRGRVKELEARNAELLAARPPALAAPVAVSVPPPTTTTLLPRLDTDDPSAMKIGELKQWLTDAGKGELVWSLSARKANKAAFVEAVRATLRGE